MANTGRVLVITLKEQEIPGNIDTGNTKANVISDDDYISPYTDLTECPVSYTTDCPDIIATGLDDSIIFEFSLGNDVINNPAIKYVKVKLMISGVEQANSTFTLPITSENYFSDTITGLANATAYDIEIDYLAPNSSVVQNCPSLATVTTT